jgi:predicted nuclease with TOPRIM domain
MSFNSPQQQQPIQSPRNDGKKWIYVVLVAALLGTWAYMFYDKSKTTETITQLQSQYTNADSARNVLQDEYNEVRSELDSLTGTNITLEGELAEKRNEIERLKQNIKTELSKKNGDLNKAKMMIAELRGKVTDLLAEVSKLKEENQQLTAANTQLATEKAELGVQKKTVEENLQKTNAEKNNLQDIASTLHASAISIQAVNVKNSGKEKETSTARRTDILRINFQIDENRIAPSGSKELYVVLIAPDGNTVSNPNTGSGVISTREMGEKTYTKKALVNYQQGVVTPVSVEWRQESAFQVGQYKVEIYHNGFKIGEGYTSLKKGGLFS